MAIVPSRMGLALWLGPLAMVPPGMAAGAPARTITKSEIRSDPPEVTDRKLRNVVWSLFEKQDHRRGKAPTRPLSRLYLRTRTQATHVPDLCRYDSVRIEFERVNPRDNGPEASVRPVGLTSSSNFTFLTAPSDEYHEIRQPEPVSVDRCSKLPEDRSFFTAENEEKATDDYRAWAALLEAIRAGRKVPLECNLYRVESGPCESIIAALKPERLSEVESCDSDVGKACHKLYVGDRLITVVTTGRVYPGPPPGRILSAKLDTLIILAHEILD